MTTRIIRVIENKRLNELIEQSEEGSDVWSALCQLQLIRKRKCSHEWEDAMTISAEGILLHGFRVCFRCGIINE